MNTKSSEKNALIVVPKINYPKGLNLWRKNVPESDKIKFINPEDFHLQEVVDGLGLSSSTLVSSFGITDTEEIIARQELMFWLRNDHRRRSILEQMVSESNLPSDQDSFLKYCNPEVKHWAHWRRVRAVLDLLNTDQVLPKRLKKLRSILRESLALEKTEREMAGHVVGQLEKMLNVEGLTTVNLCLESTEFKGDDNEKETGPYSISGGSLENTTVVGHQMYSQNVSIYEDVVYPGWTTEPWYKEWKVALGLGFLAKKIAERNTKLLRDRAYDSLKISKLSSGLTKDVSEGVSLLLEKIVMNKVPWKIFRDDLDIKVQVRFRYAKDGLSIQFLHTDVSKYHKNHMNSDFLPQRDDQDPDIRSMKKKLKELIRDRRDVTIGAQFFRMLSKWSPGLDGALNPVPSRATDIQHRWFALDNILSTPVVAPAVESLIEHRQFFYRHIKRLKEVVELVEIQMKAAKKLGSPLTKPTVSHDGHLVECTPSHPNHPLSQFTPIPPAHQHRK